MSNNLAWAKVATLLETNITLLKSMVGKWQTFPFWMAYFQRQFVSFRERNVDITLSTTCVSPRRPVDKAWSWFLGRRLTCQPRRSTPPFPEVGAMQQVAINLWHPSSSWEGIVVLGSFGRSKFLSKGLWMSRVNRWDPISMKFSLGKNLGSKDYEVKHFLRGIDVRKKNTIKVEKIEQLVLSRNTKCFDKWCTLIVQESNKNARTYQKKPS